MNWKRFWKNLKFLWASLHREEYISIVPPKTRNPLTRTEVKQLISKAVTKKKQVKKENKTDIVWPEGETTWEELCSINASFSKEELRKAIGKKMEQHRKVLT